jgi:serine-type D-Ala-D-Ala carboxypeptidase/endopeptidase
MRLLGLVPPSALPPKPRVAIALPRVALAAYAGRYRLAPGLELAVALEGDSLVARASTGSGPVRLWPESPNDFFVKEADAQVSFTRGASGAVTGLVLHQYGRGRAGAKVR